ncbi:hypothetical protein G6L09_11565 [Agrobacterium rhizogenes]|nr:hypothetical protein [Rhizobium rhizogenes]NTH71192.1 hypothetical protein [Rhizobium rhizogenes]
MQTLTSQTVTELLALHAQIGEELRNRGIVRSANNPIGDVAEHIFCKAFGWAQARNSAKGYDACDSKGTRYQIKGRRIHHRNTSRQLSAIRDIDGDHFDVLAGVLFDEGFNILRAALIPRAIVKERSTYVALTNSNRFILRDQIWNTPEVRDVTAEISEAMLQGSSGEPVI